MYVLHGNYISGHSRTVLLCAAEMGLLGSPDFKLEKTEFSASHTENFMEKHQPFGQIPYLEDTEAGLEIFEARAICKYLALKCKSKLYPQASDDLVAWKNFETASSFEMANFDWAVINYTWVAYIAPSMRMGETNEQIANAYKASLEERLPGYDRILSKQKYLSGAELTLVDLFHLPHGQLLVESEGVPSFNDGTYPNIQRWWNGLTALKSWKRVLEEAEQERLAEKKRKRDTEDDA